MIIYLLPFILILINLILSTVKVKKKIIVFINFFLIALIACVRDVSVGTDTIHYVERFTYVSKVEWSELSKASIYLNQEIGFTILMKLISCLSDNKNFFVAIVSLFIYCSFARFICKYSKNVSLSCIIFVTWDYYFHSMNLIRQYFTIAIILYGVDFLFRKKYKSYIFIQLLAFFFHKSSLVTIVLLVLVAIKKIRPIHVILALIGILIVTFSMDSILHLLSSFGYSDYAHRLKSDGGDGGGMLIASGLMIILFCSIIYYTRGNEGNDISFLAIFAMAFIIQILSLQFSLVGRIIYYFNWSLIICIPNFMHDLKTRRDSNFYLIGNAAFVVFLLVFFYFFSIPGDSITDRVIPYITFWN